MMGLANMGLGTWDPMRTSSKWCAMGTKVAWHVNDSKE